MNLSRVASFAFLASALTDPAFAQSTPLELACPAKAGLRCGIAVVDGQDGKVRILQANGAGWTGKRVDLAASTENYAVQAYAGKVLVFEYEGPAEPSSDQDTSLDGVTLLYILAPVAPSQPAK